LAPHDAKLELFQVHAVTEGTDAQAEVSVRLSHDGTVSAGKGADPDTLVASARAYVSALNKVFARRGRGPVEAVASF
jgi:2-isopropylmalate synthase